MTSKKGKQLRIDNHTNYNMIYGTVNNTIPKSNIIIKKHQLKIKKHQQKITTNKTFPPIQYII